jgi:adenylate cyclase
MILIIAVSWTIVDFILFLLRYATSNLPSKYTDPENNVVKEVALRELNVFIISFIIGYFMVSTLRNFLRDASLWKNMLIKTLVLVGFSFFMNFFIYVTYEWLLGGHPISEALDKFIYNMFHTTWLLQKMPEWIMLFIFTMLAIEINEKYSPGVFLDIMMGRYLQPREVKRIIMFLDLKDSTPIAEKLGHQEYFKFIRDFIFFVSSGIMKHNGRIYQYLGDEIVVWWPASEVNARKCINAILEIRKELNKNGERFRRRYGVVPEYKAGLHVGVVMVGQIGIIKKDLVMSGDAINTAARIRSACSDLNQKYLASKELIELMVMKDWQTDNLGPIELKGKNDTVELFALKI